MSLEPTKSQLLKLHGDTTGFNGKDLIVPYQPEVMLADIAAQPLCRELLTQNLLCRERALATLEALRKVAHSDLIDSVLTDALGRSELSYRPVLINLISDQLNSPGVKNIFRIIVISAFEKSVHTYAKYSPDKSLEKNSAATIQFAKELTVLLGACCKGMPQMGHVYGSILSSLPKQVRQAVLSQKESSTEQPDDGSIAAVVAMLHSVPDLIDYCRSFNALSVAINESNQTELNLKKMHLKTCFGWCKADSRYIGRQLDQRADNSELNAILSAHFAVCEPDVKKFKQCETAYDFACLNEHLRRDRISSGTIQHVTQNTPQQINFADASDYEKFIETLLIDRENPEFLLQHASFDLYCRSLSI